MAWPVGVASASQSVCYCYCYCSFYRAGRTGQAVGNAIVSPRRSCDDGGESLDPLARRGDRMGDTSEAEAGDWSS